MSIHSASPIIRRKSRKIWVGNVPVGGDAPIAVQSMTNTETCDVAATVAQIRRLEDAGADIVRVSVPDMDAAEAFGKIKQQVNVPLVADIHFDYRIALRVAELGVDCLRINPATSVARTGSRPWSMPRASATSRSVSASMPVRWKRTCRRNTANRPRKPCSNRPCATSIISTSWTSRTSRSASRPPTSSWPSPPIACWPGRSSSPCTWASPRPAACAGTVKSAVGLGMLLAEGIGDTIRISLAADPVEEIKVGFDILKSLHLRSRGINFIACPSCSRQNFDVVKTMNELEGRLEDLLVPMDVAVIGCVVNGPGEAKEAHVGLTGGTPNLVYIDGKPSQKLTNDNLVDELERLIRQKAAEKAEADASLIVRG